MQKKSAITTTSMLRESNAIIRVGGREYVTYRGLLFVAHENGLESIKTSLELWDPASSNAIVKATVHGERGHFEDLGDANPNNVKSHLAGATLRMASTRAQARALRSYLGVGITSLEELPGLPTSPEPLKDAVKKAGAYGSGYVAEGAYGSGYVAEGRDGDGRLLYHPDTEALIAEADSTWSPEKRVTAANWAVDQGAYDDFDDAFSAANQACRRDFIETCLERRRQTQ